MKELFLLRGGLAIPAMFATNTQIIYFINKLPKVKNKRIILLLTTKRRYIMKKMISDLTTQKVKEALINFSILATVILVLVALA